MLNIKRTIEVANTSWAELAAVAGEGRLGEMLHSGDTLGVTLKNGEAVTLRVGHDKTGKTFFAFDDCLRAEHRMNDHYTNAGGWEACEMRRYLNEDIFAMLPDDLQAVIKPTTIVQVLDGKRVETSDKLFLFSNTQMFGESRHSKYEPEDTQLDIFLTEKSRVKECGDNGTWFYFLRTPYGSNYFCNVYSGGTANYNAATNTIGVAPGFCI